MYTGKTVLIISHNPLSRVNNNGKTLVSIFKGVPEDNIYQIYLNHDIPDFSEKSHYLQLNEKQIIRSVIRGENLCCQEVKAVPNNISSVSIKAHNFGNQTKRLLREGIWKIAIWKSKLGDWLKNKKFDVIFFMAGDGLFAYDVYHFVMSHVSAKGCLFFTDDYIIGKSSHSPVAACRRFLLIKKMKKTVKITNELYVISEEMREAYHEIFQIDSFVIRNFSFEKKEPTNEKMVVTPSDHMTMVYAGGLHYSRWKVLGQIAIALAGINESNPIKCFLEIYSTQNISGDIIETLNVEGASAFLGSVSAEQIAEVYVDSDILLHVESFDKKAVASTKYSFSTKIPEYLSAGKCVFAVGPGEVSSIRYLRDMACIVSDYSELSDMLKKLINDEEYREGVRKKCEEHYEKDFSARKQSECLRRIFHTVNDVPEWIN